MKTFIHDKSKGGWQLRKIDKLCVSGIRNKKKTKEKKELNFTFYSRDRWRKDVSIISLSVLYFILKLKRKQRNSCSSLYVSRKEQCFYKTPKLKLAYCCLDFISSFFHLKGNNTLCIIATKSMILKSKRTQKKTKEKENINPSFWWYIFALPLQSLAFL